MTRLEKIRSMSAEEWAKEIMEKAIMTNFATQDLASITRMATVNFFLTDGAPI